MARNFSVALSLLLDSAQYTQSMANVQRNTQAMADRLQDIGSKINGLVNLGLAAAGVGSAFELLKKSMESTDIAGDKLEMAMTQMKEATSVFYRTLANNGDFGSFISNIKKAVEAGREYAEALDYIGNKTRGNDISNAEDERRLSEIRLALVKAKAKGMAGKEEADKLISEALAIRQAELTRNVALGAKKYSAEVDRIKGRGVDESTLIDWTRYTQTAQFNEEAVSKYQELLKKKREQHGGTLASAAVFASQGGAGVANSLEDEYKKVGLEIDALLTKYPELLKYNQLLTSVSGDEIRKVADVYIAKIQAETEINKGTLKLTKQSVAIDLMGDKADAKAEKEKQAIADKTGLMNELTTKLKEFEEAQKQATTVEGFIKWGKGIDAVKGQIETLNLELGKAVKNNDQLLKPKFSGAETLNPDKPGLKSDNMFSVQLGKATNKLNGKEAGDELSVIDNKFKQVQDTINSGLGNMVAETASKLGEAFGSIFSGGDAGDAFGNFAQGILAMIGQFMVQVGQALIAYGLAMEGFKKAFTNPFLAIGAGLALMVAGSALSNLASAGPSGSKSGGGGGGGSFSNGGGAYTSPAQQEENNRVVFEIQGNTLVGVLDNQQKRNKITR